MKNNIKYIAGILLGGLIGFSACTDSFESFNTNEAGFDNDSKKQDFNYYGIPLGIIQQGIYFNYDWGSGKNWPFQTMQTWGQIYSRDMCMTSIPSTKERTTALTT